MAGFLFLGFLIGMAHALEADHLAAVGAMAAGENSSKRKLALRGAAWGLGHATMLFAICAAVIAFGFVLSDQLSAVLEFAVGVMLVVLGIDVLRKMAKRKVHFHVHAHDEGKPHLHAHSHEHAATPHQIDPHEHRHASAFPIRAMLVGLMYGAAGSAGLLALTLVATRDPAIAIIYILLFGVGSVLGMAALSFAVAFPLVAAERHAKLLHRGLMFGSAVLAKGLGVNIMHETAFAAFGGWG